MRKEMCFMQLRVNEPSRFFEVWLTQDERDDAALQASLQPLIEEYKSRKYRPVLFVSGTEDLKENTAALLRAHRREMGDLPT